MIRPISDNISDEEYTKILESGDKIIKSYLSVFINEFVAYCINIRWRTDAFWNESFDLQIQTSISEINQINMGLCDKKEIKKILKDKYNIIIESENPIGIIDLEQTKN